ncbi:hypothetical protein DY000_02029112 [Brassica cretica]|uniref:Ubiquitin-like protease family profile domain-containing protein n=1 Tax=Brassica cretica TaxID=69181 RepID=A0ABQ7DZ80_BRACR|nr:hypothetical protein DY000_02029112 [Brassica cretica]
MARSNRSKSSERVVGKGKVTPVQVAYLVDRYLCDNRFLETRSIFRSEASSLISKSPLREAPCSLIPLDDILNEYISLKELKVTVDQENARLDQEKTRVQNLLHGMQDVMNAYNSTASALPPPAITTAVHAATQMVASTSQPNNISVSPSETNPHAYTSGKIALASETPPSTDVETLSRDVSAIKTQSAAVTEGAARDSVAVGNERSPVEEDENYESCQENISIDTPLQEKHPLAVETLPGPDTDEDDNSVESGGKRLRKKSQKIRGVYTPDARLKGLFMSEKKTEYRPLPKTSRAIFKKFNDTLSENLVQQFEIKISHIVTNSFFLDIATPHMHVIMQMLWRRRGSFLQKERIVMFDPYFTKIITSKWPAFNEAEDNLDFDWGKNIVAYITGKSRGKTLS